MARKKYSGGFEEYESKLKRVMERLGVKQYKYDWSRNECFIEFNYKNQYYRFEHSLHKAAEHKQNIHYSSDLFAQLVKTLEDIARMVPHAPRHPVRHQHSPQTAERRASGRGNQDPSAADVA